MRTRFLLLTMLLAPATAAAQWHVTLRTGVAGHSAHADAGSASDEPSFRPGTGIVVAGAAGYEHGPWRVALMVGRETPDLVLRGDDSGLITPDALRALDLGLEVGRRVAGTPGSATLHLSGGVARTRWSFADVDEPPRWRWRGLAALDGALPLAGSLDGTLRLEGAREAGIFLADELPDGYRSHGAWRATMALGVRWRP